MFPYLRNNYKAAVVKTVYHWQKDRLTTQQKSMQSLARNNLCALTDSQMIFSEPPVKGQSTTNTKKTDYPHTIEQRRILLLQHVQKSIQNGLKI